jgi:uncharacterized protein (DUF1778 family)
MAPLNTTTIKMDDYTKAVLDRAAKYTNQTRTGFILSVAVKKAEQVIKERNATIRDVIPMVLDSEDSKVFLEALESEFEPTQALLDLKKHSDSLGIIDRA